MAVFRYKALARDGGERQGELTAEDRGGAVAALQAQGLLPVAVEAAAPGGPAPAGIPAPRYHALADAAAFFGGLSALVESGLPLEQAMGLLAEMASDPRQRKLAARLREQLRQGAGLAAAMTADAASGRAFEPLAIGLAGAGEAGGTLGAALSKLARLYERRQRISANLRSALVYPLVLAVATVAVLALLMAFVIPQFELLFRDARHDLPLITRLVFGASHLLGEALLALAVLGGLGGAILHQMLRRPDRRLAFDRALLRLPVLGPLRRGVEGERLAFVLASLLGAGVAAPDALRYAADTARNVAIAEALRNAAQRLRGGSGIAAALGQDATLPPLLVRLTAIGEAAGNLPDMMLKVATLFEQETESATRRLVALVEPLMVIVLGAVIALVMVAVLSAIVDLNRLPL